MGRVLDGRNWTQWGENSDCDHFPTSASPSLKASPSLEANPPPLSM
ncbi:MAG: hypothetical protein LBJ62_01530 [Bifidobacteriaceae bacterium]|jgi:hypothetical protein|nr:hypothetical protein [Bifidobacteriaceae bacterium]